MRLGKYLSSLTKPELDDLISICGFTDEDIVIINMKRSRCTSIEISQRLCTSVSTVDRRIKYIKELIERGNAEMGIPIWEKVTLTINEAAEYSNIGINKLHELLNEPSCTFVLFVGKKKLVKRKEFERFLEKTSSV